MEQDKKKIVLLSGESGDVQESNCSCLSVMSPFDEKAEWAEIADIMASFGGSIARESVFAQDVESHFAQAFKSGNISDNAVKFRFQRQMNQMLSCMIKNNSVDLIITPDLIYLQEK